MSRRDLPVARPRKKAEFELRFATRQAEKGWSDLKATTGNALADAWDFLTRTPRHLSERNHPLKGELAQVLRDGQRHDRWQLELPGGARIWFYVHEQVVWLVDVHTHHPNQTK